MYSLPVKFDCWFCYSKLNYKRSIKYLTYLSLYMLIIWNFCFQNFLFPSYLGMDPIDVPRNFRVHCGVRRKGAGPQNPRHDPRLISIYKQGISKVVLFKVKVSFNTINLQLIKFTLHGPTPPPSTAAQMLDG